MGQPLIVGQSVEIRVVLVEGRVSSYSVSTLVMMMLWEALRPYELVDVLEKRYYHWREVLWPQRYDV